MFYFVAQKVTLMTQLKINIFNSYQERPSSTNEVKKLPFMQRWHSRIMTIKFLNENDIYNVSPCYVFV